ncbi:MAG: cupin domain-containing protein [Bacteroidales bacterium]|nr:cupin domain-containing protein [Bacteroidales bacterium]MDZ4205186.1 cupin domain-containing protein [Bacteroidales bacterium]
MKIINWREQQIKENPHEVDVRLLYDKPEAQALQVTLHPGEHLKPHITPVDVFFLVIEGTPSIQIGEEKQVTEPNMLIESPMNIVHCIFNESESIAKVLVVKAPKPLVKARLL